jgi:hypothetical protein
MDLSAVRIRFDLSIGQSNQRSSNGRSGNSTLWTWGCSHRTYSMDYVLWRIVMWSRSRDRNCPYFTSRSKLRVLHPNWKNFTNNQVEYQAVLKGIKLPREINVEVIEIFGDSQLVINQLAGEYECKDDMLRVYHEECLQLLREFKIVKLEHIPKYVLL